MKCTVDMPFTIRVENSYLGPQWWHCQGEDKLKLKKPRGVGHKQECHMGVRRNGCQKKQGFTLSALPASHSLRSSTG